MAVDATSRDLRGASAPANPGARAERSKGLRITLKPGQAIYVNGALLRVDRRVGIEIAADARFLLESHIMPECEATTLLRTLYREVQGVLMMPPSASQDDATLKCRALCLRAAHTYRDPALAERLADVMQTIEAGRLFAALREIRSLFPVENAAR